MRHTTVHCERCGAEARLIATEGSWLFDDSKAKARVMQIIECPKCGQREQSEKQIAQN
jgi:predicted nucleic-acid-binding Zn-ribbon protein